MDLITELDHGSKCRVHDALEYSLASPADCSCGAIYRHLTILQRLHDSEINFAISCFYDSCWTVKLGDDMNGFTAETQVNNYVEALAWLDKEARERFPDSLYVTGKYPAGWRPDGEISAQGA